MKLPKPLQNLKDSFESLPGIGPKTAERLTFHMLRSPQERLSFFANSLLNIKNTKICKICKNVGENDVCEVCSDPKRNQNIICVVESPLDVLALEKSNYHGLYHVLHGVINPIAGIGPEELFIEELLERIKNWENTPQPQDNTQVGSLPNYEIILATNPDLEGEATAMYIKDKIESMKWGTTLKGSTPRISRIGRGLPTGSDLEYADETTLKRALEGRTQA
jgi:recombination protein RecR